MFKRKPISQLFAPEVGGESGSAGGGAVAAPAPAGPTGGDADLARRLSDMLDGGHKVEESDAGDDGGDDDSPKGLQLQQPKTAKSDAPDAAKPGTDGTDGADDPVFTVKVDGQDKAVKQSELIAHYQKGDASAKRFEEAAQVRKAAQAAQAKADQQAHHLAEALQVYTQQLEALNTAQQPDWERLLQEDPAEFQRQRYYAEQRQSQLQQAQAAKAYLAEQQRALSEQQQQQAMEQEAQRLLEKLPEWKDAEKAKAGRAALRDALASAGFNDNEIGSIRDHRMVVVAHKAMLYDQMMAQQAKAREQIPTRLDKLPPVRVERPGSSEISPTDGRTQAMRRLNKTGSVRDAAAVIAHLI